MYQETRAKLLENYSWLNPEATSSEHTKARHAGMLRARAVYDVTQLVLQDMLIDLVKGKDLWAISKKMGYTNSGPLKKRMVGKSPAVKQRFADLVHTALVLGLRIEIHAVPFEGEQP